MRLSLKFPQLSRNGRMWIGKVTDWPLSKRPVLAYGKQGNTVSNVAEIDADPGDLLRWGRRDPREASMVNCWGVVEPNGEVILVTPEIARRYWLASRRVSVDA